MIKKNILNYIKIFSNKKDLIEKCVVDQSDYYFSRLEDINDKKIEKFYLTAICSTMADAYEFFSEILNDITYLDKLKYITDEKGKQFYKLNAVYYTIKFIFFNKDSTYNKLDLKEKIFNIFNFSKREKKIFNKFFYINYESEMEFEVKFSKCALRYMINEDSNTQLQLYIIRKFLANSYSEFKKLYERCLSKKDISDTCLQR